MASINDILHAQAGQGASYDYAFSGWDQLCSTYRSGQLGNLIGSLPANVRDALRAIFNSPMPHGAGTYGWSNPGSMTLGQGLYDRAGWQLASNDTNKVLLPTIFSQYPEAAVLVATQPRGRKDWTEYVSDRVAPLLNATQALPNDPNLNADTGQIIANNPGQQQTGTVAPVTIVNPTTGVVTQVAGVSTTTPIGNVGGLNLSAGNLTALIEKNPIVAMALGLGVVVLLLGKK